LTAITIPLFFSITNGLAIRIILYLVMQVATGKAKEVSWMTYLLGAVFVAFYAIG